MALNFSELGIIEDGAVLCLGGKIVSVGKSKDALRDSWLKKNRKTVIEIDCERQVVLPGFVDSHTHPVFVAPRLVDFEKRISGATYEEIAEAGGGIRSSVDGVRKATKNLLAEQCTADAARDFRTGHDDSRGQVGLRADPGIRIKVARGHSRGRRLLARNGSRRRCSAPMSCQKNFTAARGSTSISSAKQ